MTPADFAVFREAVVERHAEMTGKINQMDSAPVDVESDDHQADAYAEALFLRAFTAYESDIESLFLHYVSGGATLQGAMANSYLRITDEVHARRLTKAGYKFLSWAKPRETRATAENYIENGWPISPMMNAKAEDLTDCERIRNRIAHNSIEALIQFNVVQRNMLGTERLFQISPGQFLRIRSSRLRKSHIKHYMDVMNSTVCAIIDPPA